MKTSGRTVRTRSQGRSKKPKISVRPVRVKEIFQKVQYLQNHDNCLKELCQVYDTCSHQDFCAELLNLIRIVLHNDPKSPFTKCCLSFVPKLVNTLDNQKRESSLRDDEIPDELGQSLFGEEDFCPKSIKDSVFDYLLNGLMPDLESSNTNVRINSVSLLRHLLSLAQDIPANLFKKLREVMSQKMIRDRNNTVRVLAAFVLKSFQSRSSKCMVTQAYFCHVMKDPAVQVRFACLKCLDLNKETISTIKKKTRDIDAVIRKAAFEKFAEISDLYFLPPNDRVELLKQGLNDRVPAVRDYVKETLLQSWLNKCGNDIAEFITYIGYKSSNLVEKVLQLLFDKFINIEDDKMGTKFHLLVHEFRAKHLDSKKLLTENITETTAMLWRNLNIYIKSHENHFVQRTGSEFTIKFIPSSSQTSVNSSTRESDPMVKLAEDWATLDQPDHPSSQDDSAILDYILPELPHFCGFLESFFTYIEDVDIPEEIEKYQFIYNQFIDLLMLFDIGDEAQAGYLFDLIKKILFSGAIHARFTDIIAPLMKFIAKKVFSDSTVLLEFASDCTSKIYNTAAENSQEDTSAFDPREHPDELLKCVRIFLSCLKYGNFTMANSIIISHLDRIVLPGLSCRDERLRGACIKALGLSCLLSETLFSQHKNILLQAVLHDQEWIKLIALSSFFDCLCSHGLSPLIKKQVDHPQKTPMNAIESDIVDMTINHIREMTGIDEADLDELNVFDDSSPEEAREKNDSVNDSAVNMGCYEVLKGTCEAEIVESLIDFFVTQLLSSEFESIRQTSVEGFSKLMLLGVVYSPNLLCRLILIWFYPETSSEITQFLSVFLPIYVKSEIRYKHNDENLLVTGQLCFLDCFWDTLMVLLETKIIQLENDQDYKIFDYLPYLYEEDSDKSLEVFRKIDVKNLIQYMLKLSQPKYHQEVLRRTLERMESLLVTGKKDKKSILNSYLEYFVFLCAELNITECIEEVQTSTQTLIESVLAKMSSLRGLKKENTEKLNRILKLLSKKIHRSSP